MTSPNVAGGRSATGDRVEPGRSGPPDDRPASWRLLKQGPFRTYFIGSVVSNSGTWLQGTAQTLLAYQLTHSAFGVGVITAAQFTGFLIFGPWAGNLADRMGQRRVLIGTQLVSAAVAATLAYFQITGQLAEWGLFLGALVTGLSYTFALPVQNAMVARLVADRHIKGALAMNSVSYNAGRTLSPVLYIFVLATFGAGWAFAINALTFLVFVMTVLGVFPNQTEPPVQPAPGWSGMRMALRQPRIMLLLAMVAAVTCADDPVQVLGPALARQMGLASPVWPAYFLSALGLGVVLGSIALPSSIQALLRPIEQFYRSAVNSVESRFAALLLALLATSVLTFALGWNRWLSLIAAIVAGAAGLLTGTTVQALLLKYAGRAHKTQVMALWAVAWAGTKPLASLADGWLASQYGILQAAGVLVVPALVIGVLELCLRPKSRWQLKRLSWKHQKSHMYPRPR